MRCSNHCSIAWQRYFLTAHFYWIVWPGKGGISRFSRSHIISERLALNMGGGAGNGGKKWMRGLSCTSQDKKKGSEGSLGESANRTHWASKHVWVRPCSWNSFVVGMGVGAQPTLWQPWSFRSTRHALLTRTLPCSGNESKLAEGKGGPTSTLIREEGCVVRDHSAGMCASFSPL